jgi:hypothetical protein
MQIPNTLPQRMLPFPHAVYTIRTHPRGLSARLHFVRGSGVAASAVVTPPVTIAVVLRLFASSYRIRGNSSELRRASTADNNSNANYVLIT